jgi:hypothetical protein
MSYLDGVEKELRGLIVKLPVTVSESDEDDEFMQRLDGQTDNIVKFVREKLLESYKNGAQAERNRRKGKSKNKKGASK